MRLTHPALLFCPRPPLRSATQTKSVRDLARLSLTDPEYLAVHAEAATPTPLKLQQVCTGGGGKCGDGGAGAGDGASPASGLALLLSRWPPMPLKLQQMGAKGQEGQ